jgi:hypothetical protein
MGFTFVFVQFRHEIYLFLCLVASIAAVVVILIAEELGQVLSWRVGVQIEVVYFAGVVVSITLQKH